jgi:cytochrome c-type biogenesis protein CcmH/NrfG
LQAVLQQHPQSAQGYYLLGELELKLAHEADGLRDLAKAHALEPHQTGYTTAYVGAFFFTHHNQLTEETRRLLQDVLMKEPLNVDAQTLLALDAYNRKDYKAAIAHWEVLLKVFPVGSPEADEVLKALAKAHSHQ